jgi:hypothetical protein
MVDTDLIAWPFPFKDKLQYARNTIENSFRCMTPRLPQQQQEEEEAPQSGSSRDDPYTLPYLERQRVIPRPHPTFRTAVKSRLQLLSSS